MCIRDRFYGIKPEGMTAEDVIHIVEKWKEAVVGLDRMVYELSLIHISTGNIWAFVTQMAPIYPAYVRNADGSIMVDNNGIGMMDLSLIHIYSGQISG